jgi:hypothetical protein
VSEEQSAPRTFGLLTGRQGVMFTCIQCSRHVAVDRAEALRRWGVDGRPADVCRRFRCRHCGGRGARAEVYRAVGQETLGERAAVGPWDKLMHLLARLKPDGKVE